MGQERHGNYINGFSEKNLIQGNLVILAQKWHVLRNLDLLSVFLLILHSKRGQENFISCFLIINLIWVNLIFLSHFLLFDWVWSKLSSQATVTIRSLNSQDMIYFMITTGSLNSQEIISQVNIYEMDIVWRVVWFYEKASLRICYVILFECKGP